MNISMCDLVFKDSVSSRSKKDHQRDGSCGQVLSIIFSCRDKYLLIKFYLNISMCDLVLKDLLRKI